jgi:hypothetical protein
VRWSEAIVPLVASLSAAAPVLADEPAVKERASIAYTFSVDAQLRPHAGAEDLTNAFRLTFWGKDVLLDRLAGPERIPSRFWGTALRLAELVLIDTPLAISTQTFAHELFGHGGRVRELGGVATYVWKAPFPYGTDSSFYERSFLRPLTPDEQTLIAQGGLALEGVQRELTLHTAFEAGVWGHGDAMNSFAWALHLAGYGALKSGDVANWTQTMAERSSLQQPGLQQSYLISAALMEFLDPVFLYSVYAIFARFLFHGERSGPLPALQLQGVALAFSTHLDPVPWGVEYRLDLLARTGTALFFLAPRLGVGPGGSSAGVTLGLRGLRLDDRVRLGAELDCWTQPALSVVSEGVALGPPPVGPPGAPASPPPAGRVGASGRVELVFQHGPWLAGFRLGAKTAGLSGVDPIAPALETVVLLGVRLEPPRASGPARE